MEQNSGYVRHYTPTPRDLVCEFRVEPAKGLSVSDAAGHVAAESSIGTWTTISTLSPRIQKLGAKVFEVKGNFIKVAYPEVLFEENNIPQILSSVAGNIFGMKAVENLRLEDINFPTRLLRSFPGPKYGIEGVRRITRVRKRPLVGTIIKPKLGLDEKEHASVAYEAWSGGIDIVKDDENLSSLKFNRFERRVVETLKLRDRAEKETGERKMYMPNVTAETNEMLRRARFVEKQGGEYAMVDIVTTGWSGLQTLREADLPLILHGHRAGHAAFTRDKAHGISMLTIAKLSRLAGLDQLHIGTAVGKMEGPASEVTAIGEEIEHRLIRHDEHRHVLAEKWYDVKPIFAVCSGGLHPGHVPELVAMLGNDIIIQAGGGVHGHPDGTKAGAMAMRQAVDAVMEGFSLAEYGRKHKELGKAIKEWV